MNGLKVKLSLFIILLFAIKLSAQSEAQYISLINQKFNGLIEKTIYGGRIDILNNEYAIEVERASKWKSAIGQSLWYGLQTNKIPGIVLIIESNYDRKYGIMLQSALDYAGLRNKIKVWFYPEDFNTANYSTINTQSFYNNDIISTYSDKTTEKKYWLSRNSKVRHNSTCRWYHKSKGRECTKDEGRACSICGG